MTEIERIGKVVTWLKYSGYGLSNLEISKKLGYNKSAFSQILNGKVPVSSQFINKLSSANPDINKDWIRTGEGEMLKSKKQELQDSPISVTGDYFKGVRDNVDKVTLLEQLLSQYMSENKELKTMIEDLKIKLNKN